MALVYHIDVVSDAAGPELGVFAGVYEPAGKASWKRFDGCLHSLSTHRSAFQIIRV
jgi:hypothetical protein